MISLAWNVGKFRVEGETVPLGVAWVAWRLFSFVASQAKIGVDFSFMYLLAPAPGLPSFNPKILKALLSSLGSATWGKRGGSKKVGDWDQGFGDQAPCSGVRVLLGEKEESSARGEDGDLEGGWGRRR